MLLKMQGENATAIAAKDAGSAFVLSAWSNKPVEEVYHSSQGGLKLFELAPNLEIGVRNKILERVSKLVDFKGIVVSCDAYAQGKKENNIKNGFTLPPNMEKGTYNEYLKDTNDLGSILTGRAFKFEDIKEIKKVCNLPVVVKGVMCQEDALEALKQGADAIWVSN